MQTEVSNEVILKDTYSFGLVPFFNDICTHVCDVFPLLFLKVVAILRGGGGQRSVYRGNRHKFQNPAISKRFVCFALLSCPCLTDTCGPIICCLAVLRTINAQKTKTSIM